MHLAEKLCGCSTCESVIMSKKPPVKMWDKSRHIQVITTSPLEQNDPAIKAYWRNYVRELELSYKDDKFWESQAETVRSIVPPSTFKKLSKIYDLPHSDQPYYPCTVSSPVPSVHILNSRTNRKNSRSKYSLSDFSSSDSKKSQAALPSTQTQSEATTTSEQATEKISSKNLRRESFRSTRTMKSLLLLKETLTEKDDHTAYTKDDLIVNCGDNFGFKNSQNPHHEMLCTNKSETDMISWNSKYKKKTIVVSASDEFSRRAQIASKQIAMDFFEWFTSLGEVEFKSELKRSEDIEQLFQVWFDEHASRGLMVDTKILPCVLQSIASASGVPEASCPNALKRQVEFDLWAERTPKHTVAFGTCLPPKMKHIPPDNQTAKNWHGIKAPEDLATMACVWNDIKYLSSTKEFHKWLRARPRLQMPQCLRTLGQPDKKALYTMPSGYVLKESSSSDDQLELPVSKFDLELKAVLSQLMNQ